MLLIFLSSFYLKNCSGLGRTLYPDKGPSNSRAVASVLWEESRSFAHWGSPWEGPAPFIWSNSERSETLENGDLRRPPNGKPCLHRGCVKVATSIASRMNTLTLEGPEESFS